MFFRFSLALLLSGFLISDLAAELSARGEATTSETRGHKPSHGDDDNATSRSGYIIASS